MPNAMWGISACIVLVTLARPTHGQDLATEAESRGPRFLLASASSTNPTPIDVARTPILKYRLSLELDGATIKQALAEISARSGLRLVYSDAVLPSGSRVYLRTEGISVAAALTEVLLEANIDVVFESAGKAVLLQRPPQPPVGSIVGRVSDRATGTSIANAIVFVEGTSFSGSSDDDGRYRIERVPAGSHTMRARFIGYAPLKAQVEVMPDQESTVDFALEKSVQRVDELVTTGTVVETELKALPTPISIVTADEIERQNMQRVDQIFRGLIPGAVAYDQGPAAYGFQIDVRGSSVVDGPHTIKTFVDGVEIASPTFITNLDPGTIERIEVIRGPQASTLYGAGALNGVMQIFTKKGTSGATRPEVNAKLSGGSIGGFGGNGAAFQTDNSLSIFGADGSTRYNLGGSFGHTGEWVAASRSTDWEASAGTQIVQGPFSLAASARYSDKALDEAWDRRFEQYINFSKPPFSTINVRQRTFGAKAAFQGTPEWKHTLTLGYDGSALSQRQGQPRFTVSADSFLQVQQFDYEKLSLLYHTDLQLRFGSAVAAVATLGLNHVDAEDRSDVTFDATQVSGSLDGAHFTTRNPSSASGYFGQLQLSFAEQLFLSGGLRAERNDNFGVNVGTAWSPRVGAAYALDLGESILKVRGSYGESIRAPSADQRDARASPTSIQLANPGLGPERQHGVDGGVDLYLGERASIGVTYYRQRATDLIQLANLPLVPGELPAYQYQNIAEVRNNGWEFEGRLFLG
ncbi:MAG: TonB-dependent receptor, partial [bacterium]